MKNDHDAGTMRLDKWLWAARFFKTCTSAQKHIELGWILVNGMGVRNSKNIMVGDTMDLTLNSLPYKIKVTALNHQRRPAPGVRLLYAEDMDTAARREQQRLLDQVSRVGAVYLGGRPTKHDRRQLGRMKRESWQRNLNEVV